MASSVTSLQRLVEPGGGARERGAREGEPVGGRHCERQRRELHAAHVRQRARLVHQPRHHVL